MEPTVLGMFVMVALTLVAYVFHRSSRRCSLEQASQRTGCSERELRELIQTGLLAYRRKYGVWGPYVVEVRDITEARAGLVQVKEMQAKLEAQRREAAEKLAAERQAALRRRQEQEAFHRMQMAMLEQMHATLLKNLNTIDVPPDVADALKTLGLSRASSFEEVCERYRELAKRHHPDGGGNPDQFRRIHAAYARVRQWMESRRR